jgi:mannosyltransferase OCH1-like enzyme
VRKVNAWNAYEWLSAEISADITYTMQNVKIEESVNDLLRLALLIEHGGVFVKVDKALAIGNLNWLENYFSLNENQTGKGNQVLLFNDQKG